MKRKTFCAPLACKLILVLIVACMLSACDESEPLPEGVSALPDLDASELAESLADESGVIQWPADLLPEGFPVPSYKEIRSVERTGNELIIVLFGRKTMTTSDEIAYKMKLMRAGYVRVVDTLVGKDYYYDRSGLRVAVVGSDGTLGEHLKGINEQSPTGFTFEICVVQSEAPVDCLFWKFPDANTDLGLEPITFSDWPADYLPEGFPRPGEVLEILEMKQEKNGLFLTVKGSLGATAEFQGAIYDFMGYMGEFPVRNANGDYMYITKEMEGLETGNTEALKEIVRFQICPANGLIVKD